MRSKNTFDRNNRKKKEFFAQWYKNGGLNGLKCLVTPYIKEVHYDFGIAEMAFLGQKIHN